MTTSNAMLGLVAQTSIHAGAGSSVGVIDLPIQREGHSGRPCIFGSAVKGALRTRADQATDTESWLASVFGPDTTKAGDHAGALSLGDARLLLLPVRSLTSTFRWVTCPDVLRRLQRDAEMLGLGWTFNIPTPTDEQAMVNEESGDLFLEELRFTAAATGLTDLISQLLPILGQERKAELEKRLTIISDDHFDVLCRHATPVNAHIAINNKTKTAIGGALWYEETLPPESVLYVPVMAQPARNKDKDKKMTAQEVLGKLKGLFASHPWLQLGGNETVQTCLTAVHSNCSVTDVAHPEKTDFGSNFRNRM